MATPTCTLRHSGAGRNPLGSSPRQKKWIPAFAGMTVWIACAIPFAFAADAPPAKGKTMADVLAASKPADWRTLDPDNTLYLDLASGARVVIELAPSFAPLHAGNIRTLARAHY